MFLKTNNSQVIDAFNKFNADRVALRASADAFAQEYDAQAVILADSDRVYFGGINFNNNSNVNREIWRKPDRQFGISSLRVKPTKKDLQVEFSAELEKWKSLREKHFPNGTEVKKSDFYKTLGFDWSDLLFSSFACFEHNGFLYIDTSISRIAEHAEEILGSEYQAANADHKAKELLNERKRHNND